MSARIEKMTREDLETATKLDRGDVPMATPKRPAGEVIEACERTRQPLTRLRALHEEANRKGAELAANDKLKKDARQEMLADLRREVGDRADAIVGELLESKRAIDPQARHFDPAAIRRAATFDTNATSNATIAATWLTRLGRMDGHSLDLAAQDALDRGDLALGQLVIEEARGRTALDRDVRNGILAKVDAIPTGASADVTTALGELDVNVKEAKAIAQAIRSGRESIGSHVHYLRGLRERGLR